MFTQPPTVKRLIGKDRLIKLRDQAIQEFTKELGKLEEAKARAAGAEARLKALQTSLDNMADEKPRKP